MNRARGPQRWRRREPIAAAPPCSIVDDESARSNRCAACSASEFEVICASNAAEAEAVLAGELVQVILCDQRMPGESGVDFLKRVREHWPEPVRMIISGYTDAEDIIAGVNEAGIYPIHHQALGPRQADRDRCARRRSSTLPEGGRRGAGVEAKPSHESSTASSATGGASSGACSSSTASSMRRTSPMREAHRAGPPGGGI